MEFLRATDLPFDPRPQMAEIFAEGFYDHGLKLLCRDKGEIARAMEHAFILEHFYVAVEDGEIAAFVACVAKRPPPIKLDRAEMRKHMGYIHGSFVHFFLRKQVLEKPYPFDQPQDYGSIEFVATAPQHRGKGAAFQLMQYVMQSEPYSGYVLEVVGINTPAIRLYEKLGFVEFMRTKAPRGSGLDHLKYMKKEQ